MVSYFLLLHRVLSNSLIVTLQICAAYLNDSIEFVQLNELKEPGVREIEGEEGMEW